VNATFTSGPKPSGDIDSTSKGFAIAALCCAIGGFIISWFPYVGFIGIIAEIVAIVLGALAMKKIPKGMPYHTMAVAGVIIAIVLFAISIIAVIALCVCAASLIGGAASSAGTLASLSSYFL
jgi:hypothetical protein